MTRPLTKRCAAIVVVGVLATSTLLVAGPASAAPGDASALGAAASFDFTLGLTDVDADGSVGAVSVTGAGDESSTLASGNVVTSPSATGTTGVVETAAFSDATVSRGTARVQGTDVNLLGLDLFTVAEANAAAVCTVGAAPTASASLAGLTIFGQAATVNADTPTAEASSELDGEFAGTTVTVRVRQITTTTATTATATALQADVVLTGSVAGVPFAEQSAGSFTLASASCETPTAAPAAGFSARGINPATGPTTGGQRVTITGSGFVDGTTTVTFGGTPAADVTVLNPTTLVAVTPPGVAGPTTVTVANDGASAVLAYEYVEPAILDFAPRQGPEAGGTQVTFTGRGLGTVVAARFGGVEVGVTSVDPAGTSVVVQTPPGTGSVGVELVLSDGTVITADGQFLYLPAPALSRLRPASGPTAGGTVITIDGSGFRVGGTTATICGVTIPAGAVNVNAQGTQLTFVSPACAAGVQNVTVSTDGGTSAPGAFRYIGFRAAGSGAGGALAVTGATTPVAPLTGGGLLLLLGGLALIVARRGNIGPVR